MKRAKSTQQVDEAGPSLRRSSFLRNPHITYLCTICGINDALSNLCAAGAFHATKSKLNINHVIQLTKKWREMAIGMGDDDLVSRLMVGDLGANSIFYHKSCYTNLHNEHVKLCKETKTTEIRTAAVAQWLRASIFRQICMSTFEWRGFESRWCLSVGV